jgi:hypothetical protein
MFDEEEKETYYLIESFVCLNACNEREEKKEDAFLLHASSSSSSSSFYSFKYLK